MSFSRNRIRLGFDLNFPELFTNGLRGDPAGMPAGRAVEFLVALLDGTEPDNLAEFTSLTLEVKAQTNDVVAADAPALMTRTVGMADFNAGLTGVQWRAGTGYHVAFQFSKEESALAVDAATGEKLYMVLVTGEGPDGTVDVGRGKLRVFKAGGLTTAAVPVVPGPAVVREDIYLADKKGFIKKVNPAGTTFTFMNEDGYGVEWSITNGPNPEVITRVIGPAS